MRLMSGEEVLNVHLADVHFDLKVPGKGWGSSSSGLQLAIPTKINTNQVFPEFMLLCLLQFLRKL